jgi:phosphoribosylformimino-5-aminoimidazole carboxamide ribotide isomerase
MEDSMEFRPCIDLHGGVVKQIVGSTLRDEAPEAVQTNFVADKPPSWYARLYRADKLSGGHIIMLGPGNEAAAMEALAAWPGGMQLGGGITADNCQLWLARGAAAVIVTSYVFRDGRIDFERLRRLRGLVGRERLVLDLSCRRRDDHYVIVTDRWQKFTEVIIGQEVLADLAEYCAEFLVHAADVEGRCGGIELPLVEQLASWTPLPTTYAGGIADLADLRTFRDAAGGRLHVTVGSALDIFGGSGLRYEDAVRFCRECQGRSVSGVD